MLSEIVATNMDINEEYRNSNLNPFLFNPQNGLFVPKEWKDNYLDHYHGCDLGKVDIVSRRDDVEKGGK